jgi:transcription elongation factor GreB
MSRAFLSESDENLQEDDVPKIKNPLPAGVKNYMTPQGAERIRKELYDLVHKERPRYVSNISNEVMTSDKNVGEEVSRQRRKLREIDRRIEYLTEMTENIEIVETNNQAPDRVSFGTTVTVLVNGRDKQVYKIVGVDESDPAKGLISWISPLAKAMLSKSIGEIIKLKLPKGESKMKILNIEGT